MPSLQFKGKSAVETYHHALPHHTLDIAPDLSARGEGQEPSLGGNLIIEGDNLLALKALLPTHAGRVKCAYIDPPYNTGNEGWVYNDNVTQPQFKEWIGQIVGNEAEDACRHDKWCCMMWLRLKLIRELLRDDGVLLISVDENEHGHLRLILDEIFVVEKPLATFVWKRRSPSGMRSDAVSVDHEYVFLYAKNPASVRLDGLVSDEADYPFIGENDERYASTDLTIGMTCEDRPNQCYTIENPRTGMRYEANPSRAWRFEPDTMRRVIADDLVIWPDDMEGKMTRPRYKTIYDPDKPKIKPVSSWIDSGTRKQGGAEDEDMELLTTGMNAEGGKVLQRILGQKAFDYPKPPSLIQALLRIATRHDDIVLDAFAGSGTTGQAVLELNAEDGGERRFILIQMPYETKQQERDGYDVCREVTRERIDRVIKGYKYAARSREITVEGLGGSFTYARLSEFPLFGEFRDLGDRLPAYEELARYIFFTETSRQWSPAGVTPETGRIGEHAGVSFYLLYKPNQEEDWGMDLSFLKVAAEDPNRTVVVYCEMLRVHRDDLRRWQADTGKTIRSMIVPYNLK